MMPEPKVDMQELDFTEAWKNLLEVSSKLHTSSVCEKCPNQSMCHSCAAMAYAETGKTSERIVSFNRRSFMINKIKRFYNNKNYKDYEKISLYDDGFGGTLCCQ